MAKLSLCLMFFLFTLSALGSEVYIPRPKAPKSENKAKKNSLSKTEAAASPAPRAPASEKPALISEDDEEEDSKTEEVYELKPRRPEVPADNKE